jgi:hypothetical protein
MQNTVQHVVPGPWSACAFRRACAAVSVPIAFAIGQVVSSDQLPGWTQAFTLRFHGDGWGQLAQAALGGGVAQQVLGFAAWSLVGIAVSAVALRMR